MRGGRRLVWVWQEWPSFHAVVTDLGKRTEIPDESDEAALASADGQTVAAGFALGNSGTGLVEVWLGPGPDYLQCLQVLDFHSHSGAIVLGEIGSCRLSLARIGRGAHVLRILVDNIDEPSQLVFEFTRRPCEKRPAPPEQRGRRRRHPHARAQRLWRGYPSRVGPPLGGPHTVHFDDPEVPEYDYELLVELFRQVEEESEGWDEPDDYYY